MRRQFVPRRWRQRGLTLVELMVSIVIGLIVLASVLSAILAGLSSGRRQTAAEQLSDQAQYALNLLTWQIRAAGYVHARINAMSGLPETNYGGPGVRGCDTGVTQIAIDPAAKPMLADLTCVAGGAPQTVLGVAYETYDPPPANSDARLFACYRNEPDVRTSTRLNEPYGLIDNRYYIALDDGDEPALSCVSSSGATGGLPPLGLARGGEVIARGVEALHVRYGLSNITGGRADAGVVRYVTATELDSLYASESVSDRWKRVQAVQVCIQVRSSEGATDSPRAYKDCSGAVVTPSDRRLRTAVSTTVFLRNAVATPVDTK